MKKASDYFEQFKQWVEKADANSLDAFINQYEYLVRHLVELTNQFSNVTSLDTEQNMYITPSEKTPVQTKLAVINLENAKQDEFYVCYQRDDFIVKDVSFSKECGLIWNTEKRAIEGTPAESGEIIVSFLLEDGTTVQSTLFINPNPKKLWNNIPSDPQSRFWKPDNASHKMDTPQGTLIAARQRGRSHAHKGTCCDDDFALAYHQPTGIHFLAVADGAGSAEFSREGSKVAVNAAKKKVVELLNLPEKSYKDFPEFLTEDKLNAITQGIFHNAVQAAFLAQQKTATDAAIELKSLSCTLLLAFTLPLNDKRWFTACYWIGDGASAIFSPAQAEVKILGEVDAGQYSGETQFLTSNEANSDQIIKRIYTDIRDYPPLLMLMTDGVSDPKFQTDAQLQNPEKWQLFWAELNEPLVNKEPEKALEEWLDFFSKGEHDDRTLAMFIPSSIYTEIRNNKEQSVGTISQTIEDKIDGVVEADSIAKEVVNISAEATACIESESKEALQEKISNISLDEISVSQIKITLVKASDQGGVA